MKNDTRSRGIVTASAYLAIALLVSCAVVAPTDNSPAFCTINAVQIHTDFEGASVQGCQQYEGGPLLTIAPAYTPVNPSPWYAYRLQTTTETRVTLTQQYLHGHHRYHPWISQDGRSWQKLPETDLEVIGEGEMVRFSINVPAGGLYVAAQPEVGRDEMNNWMDQLIDKAGLQPGETAYSVDGHPIPMLSTASADTHGLVLLIGRQHPPELTGGFAYRDFVDRLFESDELAEDFRSRFRIAMVPMLNPDGIVRGYWRYNAKGVDLNRDWGPFTQPETRAVADWLSATDEETPLTLMLDFHSTYRDVFYAQLDSDNPKPVGFAIAWRQGMQKRLGADMPEWSGKHNPDLPTAKTWVHDTFGVTAITYEVGDASSRVSIRLIARIAAEEMMMALLEIEDKDS